MRYHVWAINGPGMLTMLVGASGMGKTELKFGLWRAQFDGAPFGGEGGLPTERGGRKLFLTEMSRGLTRELLLRWGFHVQAVGMVDRFRLKVAPRGAGAYLDVEYVARVFAPDEQGGTADWHAVIGELYKRRVWRTYDEVCFDTYSAWIGSDTNERASSALGMCGALTQEGMAVTVLHHTPKSDPTTHRGGDGVIRALDAMWSLYGVGDFGKKRKLKDPERYLACHKLRRQQDAPEEPLRLTLVPGDPDAPGGGGGTLPTYRLLAPVVWTAPPGASPAPGASGVPAAQEGAARGTWRKGLPLPHRGRC